MRFSNLAFIALAITPILALPYRIDESSISRRNTGDLQSGEDTGTGTGTHQEPSLEQPTGHGATTVKTKEQRKAEKKARKKAEKEARKKALISQAASTVGLSGQSGGVLQATGIGRRQEPSPEHPTGQGATTENKLERRRKKKKGKKSKEEAREDGPEGESLGDLLGIRSPHGNPQPDEPPAQVSGATLAQGQEHMEQLLKTAKALQAHAQKEQPPHGGHS